MVCKASAVFRDNAPVGYRQFAENWLIVIWQL
jgi:hypothetical protein